MVKEFMQIKKIRKHRDALMDIRNLRKMFIIIFLKFEILY